MQLLVIQFKIKMFHMAKIILLQIIAVQISGYSTAEIEHLHKPRPMESDKCLQLHRLTFLTGSTSSTYG